MAVKRWYLGKEKLRGRIMLHCWMTKGESCLQLLIITLCKTTCSRCICVYFTFNFSVLRWEIEETKHKNNNGAILQLAYAWERNRKSTDSQCTKPAYTEGLQPYVLKGLMSAPAHRGWVSPDSAKEQNKNHASLPKREHRPTNSISPWWEVIFCLWDVTSLLLSILLCVWKQQVFE